MTSDRAKIKAFCQARDWDQFHSPEHLAIGIATEAAELLALFRFKNPEQIRTLMSSKKGREMVSDELADIYFFVMRFSQMNRIDLTRALTAKLAKNNLKYPIHKSKGKNLKYNEL